MAINLYKDLKNIGMISTNKTATINTVLFDHVINFEKFDSFDFENFALIDIDENDAKIILNQLVDDKILKKTINNNYKLLINANEIDAIQLNTAKVYENAVKCLLNECFAYRRAYESIKEKAKENEYPIHLKLRIKPHKKIIYDLINYKIINISKVSQTKIEDSTDLKSKLLRVLSLSTSSNKDIKALLKNDNHTIKSVERILEQSQSKLDALEVPDVSLRDLQDFNTEELYLFKLNELDHLIEMTERKWTNEMLRNITIVVIMGITQIAIAGIIELISFGTLHIVAGAFLSEGISDIFFALTCAYSGYFSWRNYCEHKIISIAMTVIFAGFSIPFHNSTYSTYGQQLAESGIKSGGKNIAKMTGRELIKEVGYYAVGEKMLNYIVTNTIKSIGIGLSNMAINAIVDKQLKNYCENISAELMEAIDKCFEKHTLKETFKNAYIKLGENNAKDMINNLTIDIMSEKTFIETYGSHFKNLTQKFTNIFQTKQSQITTIINGSIKLIDLSYAIVQMRTITDTFLTKLNNVLTKKLNDAAPHNQRKGEYDENAFNNFQMEMLEFSKKILRENCQQMITEKFIKPLLQTLTDISMKKLGNAIKKTYDNFKTSKLFRKLNQLKLTHQDEINQLNQLNENEETVQKLRYQIHKEYDDNLKNLMLATNNPDVIAAIIDAGAQMDMTCVKSAVCKLYNMECASGNTLENLTIIVKGENEMEQTFSAKPNQSNGKIITIYLNNNHFQSDNQLNEIINNNDCLFYALKESNDLKCLENLNTKSFRLLIVDGIKNDPFIRNYVINSYHKLPISNYNAFGGRMKKSKLFMDENLEEIEMPNGTTYKGVRTSKHLHDRFVEYFKLESDKQPYARDNNIDRDEIMKGEKSFYKDQSSGQGYDIHAAHINQAGEVNEEIKSINIDDYNKWKNFAGRTQNVPKEVNTGKIGRAIDKYQCINRSKISKIDFNGEFNGNNKILMDSLHKDYIGLLSNSINNIEKFFPSHSFDYYKQEISKAIEIIPTSADIFQMCKDAQNKPFFNNYK